MEIESSHCISAGLQKRSEISQDRVILVQRAQRQLKNIIKGGPVYHDALMLITGKAPLVASYENIRKIPDEKLEIKYHICEYMDDSQVHVYGISGKKNLTVKTDDEIHTQFDDGEFLWSRRANDLFLCKWETKIETVKEMMKKVADKKGKYDFLTNNCKNAAERTITWIYQEEAEARGQIDSFQKKQFP